MWRCLWRAEKAQGSWWFQPGFHLSFMEDNPPYPFQRIKRVDGKDTGVIAIIAPFYDLDYYKVSPVSHPCLINPRGILTLTNIVMSFKLLLLTQSQISNDVHMLIWVRVQ